MDKFKVYTKGGVPVVEDAVNNFRFQVMDGKVVKLSGVTAAIEATLYIEQGGFVPTKSYLFELINEQGEPIDKEVDIDHFKTAVDFFFIRYWVLTCLSKAFLELLHCVPSKSNNTSSDCGL